MLQGPNLKNLGPAPISQKSSLVKLKKKMAAIFRAGRFIKKVKGFSALNVNK